MKETELIALLKNFLKEAEKTDDQQLRELVIKLADDFKRLDQPGHIPGEVSNRIIKNLRDLRKEKQRAR